jgi:hypothetical protein
MWAAWLDTDTTQETRKVPVAAELVEARYAIYAARYAARCPALLKPLLRLCWRP